jgi:antirestriction protein ArdC
MPIKGAFTNVPNYYSTLFHELTHWTGHVSRLDRLSKVAHFGNEEYSKEELVAEMGAAFLCAHTGIQNETESQSASYLASWIKVLKGDSKLALQAASSAQKATDYILGTKFESQE